MLSKEPNAFQCYVGSGDSPNSGELNICVKEDEYCEVNIFS